MYIVFQSLYSSFILLSAFFRHLRSEINDCISYILISEVLWQPIEKLFEVFFSMVSIPLLSCFAMSQIGKRFMFPSAIYYFFSENFPSNFFLGSVFHCNTSYMAPL